jgi:hypothetical protein
MTGNRSACQVAERIADLRGGFPVGSPRRKRPKRMAKMRFKIIGNTDPASGRFMARIVAFLNAMPDGQLLTCDALAPRLHYSADYIRTRGSRVPPENRVLHGKRVLYGNPKTIKAFIASLQN